MNKPKLLTNIRVVLSRTSHAGNIGAAARAMKTMGLTRLFLVSPKSFPDPQATAMASGAADVLDGVEVVGTLEEALVGCGLAVGLSARRRDLAHPVMTPREAAPELAVLAADQEVAVVFGNETSGLTNEELLRCQRLVTIPANPEYSSLNLAAAVQVVAYELRLACEESRMPAERPRPLATQDELEHFFAHLERVLVDKDFLNPKHPGRLMQRLRRLYARTGLEKDEVAILRGILTAVEK